MAVDGQFGATLRWFRSSACLTQEEVARRSGLSVRALSDMERGRTARPLSRSVRLLADALELDGPARAQLVAAMRGGETTGHGIETESGDSKRLPMSVEPPQLPVSVEPPQLPLPVVPRQLPAPIKHFVGRSAELRALSGLLDEAVRDGTAMTAAVDGTAGVGKTALAVNWAHLVADRFPDGQLYVNLRGFDASAQPITPAEALEGFLKALGLPRGQVPVRLDAKAALYRSLLAGRRVVVVLDDARDEQQLRPLLPGGGRNLVIVTSRNQLLGLVAIEGAHHLCLELLSEAEAWQLLAGRLGGARLNAEPKAVAELIEFCARLPLALALASARAAVRPAIRLGTLAAELRDQGQLDALDHTDKAANIRAVFSGSYHNLGADAARMFRLLAVHPGPDISAAAAASLANVTTRQARQLLNDLARCHMLAERVPGRFALHDLLRAYAFEQAQSHQSLTRVRLHHLRTLDQCQQTAD